MRQGHPDDDAEWDVTEADFDARFASADPTDLVEPPSGRVYVAVATDIRVVANFTDSVLRGVPATPALSR